MVNLFGRRGKVIARKKIKCHICGLEKEMTWCEYLAHMDKHIKNGEISDIQPGISGELVGWSDKDGTRTSTIAKGKD